MRQEKRWCAIEGIVSGPNPLIHDLTYFSIASATVEVETSSLLQDFKEPKEEEFGIPIGANDPAYMPFYPPKKTLAMVSLPEAARIIHDAIVGADYVVIDASVLLTTVHLLLHKYGKSILGSIHTRKFMDYRTLLSVVTGKGALPSIDCASTMDMLIAAVSAYETEEIKKAV